MILDRGAKLGPYEILAPIGAGGMGEVYRAHDPRMGRDVAIKLCSERFSERFDREVRAVAALNHPNICHLYDVGPNYLVMELVEGPTIAERLKQGAVPLDEALAIAKQIADALEAAHENGVVHRDLKPANIKVRPDGTVKVLDFGLAKMAEPAEGSGRTENSPTLTLDAAATRMGVVLGTAAYMPPEQARGKRVDRRADIWAFGVVLYEMLTGERLFEGETVSDTLIEVATKEPDWNRLAAAPGKNVRRLLRRCLEKDPKRRLRDIGEAWFLLEETPPASTPAITASLYRSANAGWITAALFALAAATTLWAPWDKRETLEPVRFGISAPPKSSFTNFLTISPDGRKVAFTAQGDEGVRLWVRPLDSLEATALTNTAVNPTPFWSPDSSYIAYQLDGKLRKIAVSGGSPQTLCDAPLQFEGGTWSQDNVIVFAGPEGLLQVSAAGGVPKKLTSLDASKQETAHAAPVFLPDGHHFIYSRRSLIPANSGVSVGSVDETPEKQPTHRLLVNTLNVLFAPPAQGKTGYLLFARENALVAQPFDTKRLTLTGEAAVVADPVGQMADRFVSAAVSASGVLVYRTSGSFGALRQLASLERGGKAPIPITTPGGYQDVKLSPDGTQAAVSISQQNNTDLWTVDLGKALKTRFTFHKAEDRFPIWSPDGSRIVFSSTRDGARNLYWKAANGATDEEALLKSGEEKVALDWSRDGKYLLYEVVDPKTRGDLWYLPMKEAERKPVRYLATELNEAQGQFSPDGHFVAYIGDESGVPEVYVRTFPDPSGRWQVSRNGGSQPRWGRDGKELFFLAGGSRITSVDVTTGATFQSGEPKTVFDTRVLGSYDVTADGQRFLVLANATEGPPNPITVVLNWQAGLKK
jgi:eukaryotic-like serine/threonine-protein kinase